MKRILATLVLVSTSTLLVACGAAPTDAQEDPQADLREPSAPPAFIAKPARTTQAAEPTAPSDEATVIGDDGPGSAPGQQTGPAIKAPAK